ncbi:ROK family protein [Iamia sp.]|uniref:ROK family protein n=1 Tax=Iamia sp. TaxID=2722710 RepID=UPI002C8D8914|nr:ROK family protein [Iamia sp.]HXH58190.1 ROK family protein [Iamia sp.]
MAPPTVLAIDIGGTKLAAGLVDRQGALTRRRRAATPSGSDPEALFETLVALVADVVDGPRDGVGIEGTTDDGTGDDGTGSAAPVAVGVGCGGPMAVADGVATVSPLNIPAWRGFPLADRLAEHVGLPTAVDNDAKALALGEGWVGAAVGVDDYIAMVVSTGVGGGIVLDGRLLDGAEGNAGHIGHLIVEPGGRTCPCGAAGCLEAEVSGLAIAAATGRPAAEAPRPVRVRTGTLVGRAVASVANLLDLRLACVAGSVALGFGEVFLAAARAEVDACARLSFSRSTEIRLGGLGDRGPLVGAGALGWRLVDGL